MCASGIGSGGKTPKRGGLFGHMENASSCTLHEAGWNELFLIGLMVKC